MKKINLIISVALLSSLCIQAQSRKDGYVDKTTRQQADYAGVVGSGGAAVVAGCAAVAAGATLTGVSAAVGLPGSMIANNNKMMGTIVVKTNLMFLLEIKTLSIVIKRGKKSAE